MSKTIICQEQYIYCKTIPRKAIGQTVPSLPLSIGTSLLVFKATMVRVLTLKKKEKMVVFYWIRKLEMVFVADGNSIWSIKFEIFLKNVHEGIDMN